MIKWKKFYLIIIIFFILFSSKLLHKEYVYLGEENGVLVEVKINNYLLFITTFQTRIYNQTDDEIRVAKPITKLYISSGINVPSGIQNDVIRYVTVKPNSKINGKIHLKLIYPKNRHFATSVSYQINSEGYTIHIADKIK